MGRVTTRVPRTRVDVAAGTRVARPDTVAVEEPLEMRVAGSVVATTMRTPGDDFDLTIGHLLTEGLLRAGSDVGVLMHCTDVGLSPGVALAAPPRPRTETMTSACGVCGSASIDAIRTHSRYAARPGLPRLDPEVVAALPDTLRLSQATFERTGGLHAAGLFTADGSPLVVREDVGRHNAVDKAVGAVARTRSLPFDDLILVVSARASFEIVQKATMAGVPVVVAVGAPSSLAVELARDAGLTLIAFARGSTFSIYADSGRLLVP